MLQYLVLLQADPAVVAKVELLVWFMFFPFSWFCFCFGKGSSALRGTVPGVFSNGWLSGAIDGALSGVLLGVESGASYGALSGVISGAMSGDLYGAILA